MIPALRTGSSELRQPLGAMLANREHGVPRRAGRPEKPGGSLRRASPNTLRSRFRLVNKESRSYKPEGQAKAVPAAVSWHKPTDNEEQCESAAGSAIFPPVCRQPAACPVCDEPCPQQQA